MRFKDRDHVPTADELRGATVNHTAVDRNDGAEADTPAGPDDDDDGLEGMKKPALVALALEMGLDTSGTKADLVERIENAQAEAED